MSSSFKLLDNKKGKKNLHEGGYVYHRASKRELRGGRISWECWKRRKGCPAKLKTKGEKITERSTKHHNHSPDKVISEASGTSTTAAPRPARGGSSNKATQFVNQTDERSSQGSSQPGPSQQSAEQNYDRRSGLDMLIAAAQALDQGSAPLGTEATSSHKSHTTYAQSPAGKWVRMKRNNVI